MKPNCLVSNKLTHASATYEYIIERMSQLLYSQAVDSQLCNYSVNTYLTISKHICGELLPRRDYSQTPPEGSTEPVSK